MNTLAYDLGRKARDNNKPTSDNPYVVFGSQEHVHWRNGWYDRHEELSREFTE